MHDPLQSVSPAEFLSAELSNRKQRNDAYSARAFARDLGLSPSRLSEVLSGSHGVSESTADRIALNLKLKPTVRKFWKDLILATSSRNQKVRELAQKRVSEFRKVEGVRRLEEEQFRVISDWYHGAILELTQVQGFRSDVNWIAERLGIAIVQVEGALYRLKQLGLLRMESDGCLVACLEAFNAFSDVPSSAIRKFHRQILTMHMESLIEDSMSEREAVSMILAIPKARMPEFQQEMKAFVTQFWQRIENDDKDALYSLSVPLCPVRNRRGKP
jgi:uncharacterized protein (TIGR02147 family)